MTGITGVSNRHLNDLMEAWGFQKAKQTKDQIHWTAPWTMTPGLHIYTMKNQVHTGTDKAHILKAAELRGVTLKEFLAGPSDPTDGAVGVAVEPEPAQKRRYGIQQAVFGYFVGRPGEPMHVTAVHKAIESQGWTFKDVCRVVARLADRDELEWVAKGTYKFVPTTERVEHDHEHQHQAPEDPVQVSLETPVPVRSEEREAVEALVKTVASDPTIGEVQQVAREHGMKIEFQIDVPSSTPDFTSLDRELVKQVLSLMFPKGLRMELLDEIDDFRATAMRLLAEARRFDQ